MALDPETRCEPFAWGADEMTKEEGNPEMRNRQSIRCVLSCCVALLFAGLMGCASGAPEPDEEEVDAVASGARAYDAELARRLGADRYGMRRYVIAFLRAGPERGLDRAQAERLQRAHLANIERLAEEGKLALAGPFLDGGDLRGIFVFSVVTVEEAKALAATDPAVRAGLLTLEYHPWYGSAAVAQIAEIHERLARENP